MLIKQKIYHFMQLKKKELNNQNRKIKELFKKYLKSNY
jgi:hypothetical protein